MTRFAYAAAAAISILAAFTSSPAVIADAEEYMAQSKEQENVYQTQAENTEMPIESPSAPSASAAGTDREAEPEIIYKPGGTAGRLYFPDGSSFALNWSDWDNVQAIIDHNTAGADPDL